jgi:hypothetical protein
VGGLGDDRIVVDIRPESCGELRRHVVDLACGELDPVEAPGDGIAFGDDLLLSTSPSPAIAESCAERCFPKSHARPRGRMPAAEARAGSPGAGHRRSAGGSTPRARFR